MRTAKRIDALPPYLFAEIDRKVAEKKAEGVDVISFGVGDPDMPSPDHVVAALKQAVDDPTTHQYPSYYGMPAFRDAIARWYATRFGVELDPASQVQPLVGSKEGIFHLPVAFVDPGDTVLVPDPAYPVYEVGTLLAGGTVQNVPLAADNGFFPDFDSLSVAKGATILWLNYPSNPTAAVATIEQLETALAFAEEHDLLVAYDNAYSELTFDGFTAPSILQARGGMERAIEFHSLSKTYNMTGWRIAWACGNTEAVEALSRVKTNVDSGIFNAIQHAGIAALDGPQEFLADLRAMYQRRRDRVVETLHDIGLTFDPPKGSVFVGVPGPEGHDSASFATLLLNEAGVVVPPGAGYGPSGEGFVRFSLTVPDDRIEEGLERIRKALG